MKKIAFIVSLLCLTLSVTAQSITSTSRIVLKHTGQPNQALNFILSSSFSDGFDNTWDAVAVNPGGVYVYDGEERYTTWASNAYSANLPVGFATYNDDNTSYTLSFENFEGVTYKLFDTEADEVIEINGSTPDYVFTASPKNTTFNERFLINVPVDTDPLETCFTGTELQITNNPFYGKITVKTGGGSTVKQYAYGTSSIDFNETDGGGDYIYSNNTEYTVSFGTSRSFIVKVKR